VFLKKHVNWDMSLSLFFACFDQLTITFRFYIYDYYDASWIHKYQNENEYISFSCSFYSCVLLYLAISNDFTCNIFLFLLTKDIYYQINDVNHCFTNRKQRTFICFRFMWLNGSIHFLLYFNSYFIPIKSIK